MHLSSLFSTLFIACSLVVASPVKRGMRRIARPVRFRHVDPHAPPQNNFTSKVFNLRGCRRDRRRIAEKLERSRLQPLGGKKVEASAESAGTVLLTDDYEDGIDSSYYGNLFVGTPYQNTTVDFDTGSSDIVIPLDTCKGVCEGPLFNSTESSTFKKTHLPYSVSYDDGTGASGFLAYDTIQIAGLTVENQAFGAVTKEYGNFSGPFAGMVGLGFPANADAGTPWFANLVKSEVLEDDLFSMYLVRGGEDGSSLCLGCIDNTTYTGNISYYPIDTSAYKHTEPWWWNVESPGLAYNGSLINLPNAEAMSVVIDSGTTIMYVPSDLASQLYAQVPNATEIPTDVTGGETGYYWFPCTELPTLPPVAFRFGSSDFAINAQDFNAGVYPEGSTQCVGAIAGYDISSFYLTKPIAIAGDSFIKSWMTVFDYGKMRVGFAEAV